MNTNEMNVTSEVNETKGKGFDWITLSRNYSRREGTEMFSLTENRQVEKNSTYYRMRLEKYILLHDIQIQVLEEMVIYGYVTKEFLQERKKSFSIQMKALIRAMKNEMESGTLSREQIDQNHSSIEDAFTRLGNLLGERPVINAVPNKVEEKVVIDSVEPKVDEKVVDEKVVEEKVVEEKVVDEKVVDEKVVEEPKVETKVENEDDNTTERLEDLSDDDILL